MFKQIISNIATVLMILGAVTSVSAGVFERQNEGQVNFIQWNNRAFDPYTNNPSDGQKVWLNDHYWRMITHPPYFDTRLSWYSNAWAYFDISRVYVDPGRGDSDILVDHPEWIYKDASGNKLYIPWGCSGGTCPQYAANIGDPDFRAFRIAQMAEILKKGYRGLWLDDVNMLERTSNGNGVAISAIDTNTGKPMTLANWRNYMALYTEEVRAAFPDIEIVHNALWFADQDFNEPAINRQLLAADYFNAERGATDAGLVRGEGRFGYKTFLKFMDHIHGLGRGVLFMDYGKSLQERQFGLASWFLMSEGIDMMTSNQLDWTAPDHFWPVYNMDLGQALGSRYETAEQLIRRDFECGSVILNPPGGALQTLALNETFINVNGRAVTSIKLSQKSAMILSKACVSSGSKLRGVVAASEINHQWTHFDFEAIKKPVVIAAAPGYKGRNPGVMRVRNINNNGFEMQFQEWDYSDTVHVVEPVAYLALESGRYELSNGTVVEVGTFDQGGTGQWRKHSFSSSFPVKPVLFLTMQTYNGRQTATVRARNISVQGFESAIYEQESFMDGHRVESIGFVAVYAKTATGTIDIGSQSLPYEIRQRPIGHEWVSVMDSLISMQEEQSADQEIRHLSETVDLLRLGEHIFVQDVSTRGSNTVAPRRIAQ